MIEFLKEAALKLFYAIITFITGLVVIGRINSMITGIMQRNQVDKTLQPFLSSLLKNILRLLLAVTVLSMLGVEMTSFIAVLGAAGLAVGLALQGSLSNFAGGVLILLFKPFEVEDYIEAQGHSGTVKEIQIFQTTLLTPDNKTIIIPNGDLSNGSIVNYSRQQTRRVDMVFGISYEDDIKKAKKLVEGLIKKDGRILEEPSHTIKVVELAENSVNLGVRVWCRKEDYWNIYFDMMEDVKMLFDKKKISIPYPQMDVHLQKKTV